MSLSAKLIPSSGVLFGMWVGTSCGDTSGTIGARIHNIETTINRTDATNGLLNIFHDYTNWDTFASGATFPAGSEATLASEGRIFLCNWTPKLANGTKLLWSDVAAGVYDNQYVIPTATKMRDYGKPFFLVPHTEANHFSSDFGVTDTWGTSAQYVAAHQHLWNVFQSVGCTNAVWVWNVTGYGFANMPLYNGIYPGDAYVDWIGFDPYSAGASGGWEDYAYTLGTKYPLYQWATGTHPTSNKTSIPAGITVTPQGATGAATYSYKLSSVNAQGETLPSAAVQITNGNATLSGTNFNRIAWTASSGASSTKIYGRTSGSWLLIATVTAPTATYDDTGAVTPSGAPKTVGDIGRLDLPVMWQEWGVEENGGVANGGVYPNTKAGFYNQVQTGLKAGDFPLTKAIVYYNSTGGGGQNCINSSSQALSAFRALAADPFFNPDMSATPPPPPGTIRLRGANSAPINKAKNVGVQVPATAQAGDGMAVFCGMTRAAFRNSCEGTNGANITLANSNSSGSNPADVLTATAPTYDTTQKHSGSSSMHASLSSGTDCHFDWTTSFPWPTTPNSSYYGRAYFRRSAAPSAIVRIYQQNSAANANQWGIAIDTGGALIVRDVSAGATRLTMASSITINTWHRVEWKATWTGSQTTVTVRLYLDVLAGGAAETTLDEEQTSTSFAQAAAPGRGKFGLLFSSAATYDLYHDDFGLDAADWLGAAGTPAVLTAPGALVPLGADTNVLGSVELLTKALRKTVATGDPGSTLTFSTDVEVNGAVLVVCWSGTDQSAIEDVIATPAQRQSNATTITSPTTPTTTVASDWIITAVFDRALAGSAANTSWTVASETVRTSAFGTGTDGRVSGAVSDDGVGHAVGTYGGRVATAAATSYLATAWTLAIRPATAGGGDTQSCGYCGIPS